MKVTIDGKKIGHGTVKTEGFEKTIAFESLFTSGIAELMRKNKSFVMVLTYDSEALNVDIDFYEPTVSSDGRHKENQ